MEPGDEVPGQYAKVWSPQLLSPDEFRGKAVIGQIFDEQTRVDRHNDSVLIITAYKYGNITAVINDPMFDPFVSNNEFVCIIVGFINNLLLTL